MSVDPTTVPGVRRTSRAGAFAWSVAAGLGIPVVAFFVPVGRGAFAYVTAIAVLAVAASAARPRTVRFSGVLVGLMAWLPVSPMLYALMTGDY